VEGCYICDLLSWVIGRCGKNAAWVTIQTNQNVVAVALLAEAACVIIPEGIVPEKAVLERAQAEGIAFLSSPETAYQVACKLKELI
jgi:hypothetical protein